MAYRDKTELNGDPNTEASKYARRYVFGVLPMVVLAPNLGRIARLLGFHATYDVVLFIAVGMTVLCIVGGIVAFKSARAQAARDLAELTGELSHKSARFE